MIDEIKKLTAELVEDRLRFHEREHALEQKIFSQENALRDNQRQCAILLSQLRMSDTLKHEAQDRLTKILQECDRHQKELANLLK